MKLRGVVSLIVALSLIVMSSLAMNRFSSAAASDLEELRMIRYERQTLQQQIKLLERPDMQPSLVMLTEEMDSLRIRLIEALTQTPLPVAVQAVDYELAILPATLEAEEPGLPETGPVSVLRMELSLAVQHSGGLLRMLDLIGKASGVWPHETRGCSLHRTGQRQLTARCALNVYHWQHQRPHETTSVSWDEALTEASRCS